MIANFWLIRKVGESVFLRCTRNKIGAMRLSLFFKFIENATIHVFFLGAILASFLPHHIDKIGVVFYGLVGLGYRFGKPFRKEVDSLMIFVAYLMAVALSYSLYKPFLSYSLYKPFLFACLFLLQYGVIYYFIIVISQRGQALTGRWLNTIVRYHAFFILIGLIDLIFYYNGVVTFIHEYIGWKTSSFYRSPNYLGILSGALFGFVLLSGVAIRARKLYLFILVLSTIISGSTMAMLLVPASYVLKHISIRLAVITAVVMAAFLTVGSITWAGVGEWVRNALNYRLEIWLAALEVFGDHKFFGMGTGMFKENVTFPGDVEGMSVSFGLHSIYLWLLIECGLIGLSIYAWFIFLQFNLLPRERLTTGYQKILLLLLFAQLTEFYVGEIFQLLYCLILGLIIQRKGIISQSVKNENV